jgi:integrase
VVCDPQVQLLRSLVGGQPFEDQGVASVRAWPPATVPVSFPSRKGGFLPLGEYRWAFDNACDEVGIEGLVPHGLRHTTASLAISAGANVKVVQRLLGHATDAMTLDRYGHLLDDDLSGVPDALAKAIDSIAVSLRYPESSEESGDARNTV